MPPTGGKYNIKRRKRKKGENRKKGRRRKLKGNRKFIMEEEVGEMFFRPKYKSLVHRLIGTVSPD
jgi:hypothetical protein